MSKTLNIEDVSLLRITKVRDWAIYFDYDKEHYLLHGGSDGYEHTHQLYKRILDEHGKYELIFMFGRYGDSDYLARKYVGMCNGRTWVYSQIDMDLFAYKLTSKGFATGIKEKEVEENKEVIKELDKMLAKIERIKRGLLADRERLT